MGRGRIGLPHLTHKHTTPALRSAFCCTFTGLMRDDKVEKYQRKARVREEEEDHKGQGGRKGGLEGGRELVCCMCLY